MSMGSKKKELMMITVSEMALEKIREVKEKEIQNVRLGVLPGGCSGFQYTMHLEDDVEDDDEIIQVAEDINLIVDMFSFQYLEGIFLDYKMDMMGSGFVFNNPNATGGCGCGSSFTV